MAELAAFGPVLGIVDHHIFAAGERERVVQRLRLGARMKRGHDDDLDIAGKAQRACRRNGRVVHRFEDELDVELRRRIVETRERSDERREHMGLAVKRHQQGVDGQLVVRHARMGA